MGQESSSSVDESTPPETLDSRTLDGVARYIRSGKAKRIVVMTGAGISTSAGIPDFRSPDTGLYANLARLDLPYAEAVFDISYFRQNPKPFYTLAQELYPGRYRPTVTHSFFKVLQDKGLLLKLFTQNIDCLEREAGVSGDKMVEAHGSFARQSCIECHSPYPDDEIRKHIDARTIPRCLRQPCGGLVKPEIVFFGEQLPQAFFLNRDMPAKADLCIVLGSSLTVQPFASLPGMCREGTPRLLINKERVGGIGSRPDDVVLLGDCDEGVRKLAVACGWEEALDKAWASTAPTAAVELGRQKKSKRTTEEGLENEVDQLTREIDETLNLSKWHGDKVRQEHIEEDRKRDSASPSSTSKANEIVKHGDVTEADEKSPHYDVPAKDGSLQHVFPHIDKKSSL